MRAPPGGLTEELVWDAARRAAPIPGLERRRSRLLRTLLPDLGPAQLEHIALHCEHVSRTASRIACLMRIPPIQVEQVRLAALMHDIGKALTPEPLLSRAGPLSRDEQEMLARHAMDGARLCRLLGAPEAIASAVEHHHTRHDESPGLPARIIAVADALVVMTTGRAYTGARPVADALAELRGGRGTLFDPNVVIAAHIHGASLMALAA